MGNAALGTEYSGHCTGIIFEAIAVLSWNSLECDWSCALGSTRLCSFQDLGFYFSNFSWGTRIYSSVHEKGSCTHHTLWQCSFSSTVVSDPGTFNPSSSHYGKLSSVDKLSCSAAFEHLLFPYRISLYLTYKRNHAIALLCAYVWGHVHLSAFLARLWILSEVILFYQILHWIPSVFIGNG